MDIKQITSEKLSAVQSEKYNILEQIRVAELTNNKAEAIRLKSLLPDIEREIEYYNEVGSLSEPKPSLPTAQPESQKAMTEVPEKRGDILGGAFSDEIQETKPDFKKYVGEEVPKTIEQLKNDEEPVDFTEIPLVKKFVKEVLTVEPEAKTMFNTEKLKQRIAQLKKEPKNPTTKKKIKKEVKKKKK